MMILHAVLIMKVHSYSRVLFKHGTPTLHYIYLWDSCKISNTCTAYLGWVPYCRVTRTTITNKHLLQRLLAAVSLWQLKKAAATGDPSSFSSENLRVLNRSLERGALNNVCLFFCLNSRNTNLWIPIFGLGISYPTISLPDRNF